MGKEIVMKTKKTHNAVLTLGSWLRPATFDSVTVHMASQTGQALLWGLRQQASGTLHLLLTLEISVRKSPLTQQ